MIQSNSSNNPKDNQRDKLKKTIFKNIRQTANFSQYQKEQKLGNFLEMMKYTINKNGDTTKQLENLKEGMLPYLELQSPKLNELIQNIKQLDEQDQKVYGKKFKHFIFSDVKEGGYGAMVIGSALFLSDYDFALDYETRTTRQGNRKSYLKLKSKKGDSNSFAVLLSGSLVQSTFNNQIKKDILTRFNTRPDNIHGENLRIIVLDSGFKEGIDLFDVKYVHIFEPSMTIADLKQTVGRATRTCGQKGLQFIPNEGWNLYVYKYFTTIPTEVEDLLENGELKGKERLFDLALEYSSLDRGILNLSEQLFELGPQFAVDYELTQNIHQKEEHEFFKIPKEPHSAEISQKMLSVASTNQSGGVRKYSPRFENVRQVVCGGKCGLRSTKDIPLTTKSLQTIYLKLGMDRKRIPKVNSRAFFCQVLRTNEQYCKEVNKYWRKIVSIVPIINDVMKHISQGKTPTEKQKKYIAELMDIDEGILPADLPKSMIQSIRQSDIVSSVKSPTPRFSYEASRKPPSVMSIGEEIIEIQPASPVYANLEYEGSNKTSLRVSEKKRRIEDLSPSKIMGFRDMRDYIHTNFNSSDFIWPPLKIENRCGVVSSQSSKTLSKTQSKTQSQKGGNPTMIDFNPTQNFVRHYFTPSSAYKGLLLWHSVGTGKTCSAIATASSTFIEEDYTVLWVTRTTLKSDVWKNMFHQVCNVILQDKIRNGLILPSELNKQKRLISKNWIEPISYKQFSNLLDGKNQKLIQLLQERNGRQDILRKTLVIIDEAHKLYGGDLKASERPNMRVMERLIKKSYSNSKQDSVKLLIMTATPFTNSPMELFKLINLCKTRDFIPDVYADFEKEYLNQDKYFSKNGVKKLANQMSGYISYLNRENDPSQFAQPVFINVPVFMSYVPEEYKPYVMNKEKLPTLKEATEDIKQKIKDIKDAIKILVGKVKENKNVEKEFNKTRRAINKEAREKKTKCRQTHKGKPNKEKREECIERVDDELEMKIERLESEFERRMREIQTEDDDIYETIDKMNEEIENFNNKIIEVKEEIQEKKDKIKIYKEYMTQDVALKHRNKLDEKIKEFKQMKGGKRRRHTRNRRHPRRHPRRHTRKHPRRHPRRHPRHTRKYRR